MNIRNAKLSDAAGLLAIYDYYVQHTAISFEYETPTLAQFEERMRTVMARYPYLVAEAGGQLLGYAYAHPFVGRAAYDWGAETTIYLAPGARRGGIGKALYAALEQALRVMGVLNMYACVGTCDAEDEYLTNNSADFHRHIGFKQVGEFKRCGRKFGRWYDMVWLEKPIGEYRDDQPPVGKYKY